MTNNEQNTENSHEVEWLMRKITDQSPDAAYARRAQALAMDVVTHYGINTSKVRLYKLSEYTDELADVHGVDRKRTPDFSVKYLKKLLSERISSEFLR